MSTMLKLKDIVDTVKYPIDHPDKTSLSYNQFVASVKQEFVKSGIVTLPGFLKPDALENITAELNLKSDKAWKNDTPHNIYLDDGDHEYQNCHIRNRTQSSQVRNLPYDCISQESPLRLLYNNRDLCEFLRQVLGQPKLYTLADPLGACSVNIFKDGENFAWHYDQATFSTTIMLQKPKEGGLFQLTGPIRGSPDENGDEAAKRFDIMSKIVQDSQEQDPPLGARNMEFEPGTLSIFQGSQCLHRVTKCKGTTDRLVAVLGFSTRQGHKFSAKVHKDFWGRTNQNIDGTFQ